MLTSQEATVLVVDDEELLRQAVSKMLRKKGLFVIEASDGFGALDVIRRMSVIVTSAKPEEMPPHACRRISSAFCGSPFDWAIFWVRFGKSCHPAAENILRLLSGLRVPLSDASGWLRAWMLPGDPVCVRTEGNHRL